MSRSKQSKLSPSSSRAATSQQSSSAATEQSLGDFDNLWRFLQSEKEKWGATSQPALLEVTPVSAPTAPSGRTHPLIKQTPQLPHSSSSEYSSEEEFLLAGRKPLKLVNPATKKKKVRVVALNQSNQTEKKTTKKTGPKANGARKDNKPKSSQSMPENTTPSSPKKKVHFDDEQLVESLQNNKLNAIGPKPIANPKGKKKSLLTPHIPIPIAISPDPIHIFVDNSNIYAGFLAYCRERQISRARTSGSSSAAVPYSKPKLNYQALFTILERERNVDRKVLVASSPLDQRLDEAENDGYDVSVLRRVKTPHDDETGTPCYLTQRPRQRTPPQNEMEKEQCVDELIHLKILESLLDYSAPATLVLASGDGKDAEYFQGGFHKCVVMALMRGWKVEVISWQRQLSQNFLNKKFLGQWKGRYHVVFLDWFAKELGCEN